MTDEHEPREPVAHDDSLRASLPSRLHSLLGHLRRVADEDEENRSWFALWLPVFQSSRKLGATLLRLAFALREAADAPRDVDPIPEDLRGELREDFEALARDFPDLTDLLFGASHLDEVLHRALDDEAARESARAAARHAARLADEGIHRLIDLALTRERVDLPLDTWLTFFTRAEKIAEKIIDRWVLPIVLHDRSEQA